MQRSVQSLVGANPCAFSLISAFGRNYPRCRNVSASRARSILQADGENFSPEQILVSLRLMSEAGIGKVRWNNDSQEFSFAWDRIPAAVLEMLRTEQNPDDDMLVFQSAAEDDFETELSEPMRKHRFALREDCVIGLELPDDLTKREARKICMFLKALAFKAEAWPFPRSSKLDPSDDEQDYHYQQARSFSDDEFLESALDEGLAEESL